jgi:Asp-tRNA(Asn)/Glu-tRNA(Gln) amidotransferase A subunit family amidase
MDSVELAFAGAVEQARLVRTGEVSAREAINAALARIDALDPKLNAFGVVFAEQALADALLADDRRANGPALPLDGVTVAIKDDADVAGEVTAWGTDAYGDAKSVDSAVVRRLPASAKMISKRQLRKARNSEQAIAERINRSFDDADVVLTPMAGWSSPLVAEIVGKGLLRSLRRANAAAWAGQWNVIGQPAASVPVGVDRTGLPLAVQIYGRKHDEITLLHLAAQLEEAHPWSHVRPRDTKAA